MCALTDDCRTVYRDDCKGGQVQTCTSSPDAVFYRGVGVSVSNLHILIQVPVEPRCQAHLVNFEEKIAHFIL